jgi:hypothetical protein
VAGAVVPVEVEVEAVEAGALDEVLVVGAGLVGGIVLVPADVPFELLPHAASTTTSAHAKTEEPRFQDGCTGAGYGPRRRG